MPKVTPTAKVTPLYGIDLLFNSFQWIAMLNCYAYNRTVTSGRDHSNIAIIFERDFGTFFVNPSRITFYCIVITNCEQNT